VVALAALGLGVSSMLPDMNAPTSVGFMSGSMELTPSPKAANATTLRPLVASSVICC